MLTVRQIEKYWSTRSYGKLFAELLTARPEASARLEAELGYALPAAALAMIRLEELHQSRSPLYARLRHLLRSSQNPDGSFGEPLTTTLCLRALAPSPDDATAVDRGARHLASLQCPAGLFENDRYLTTFILFHLGDLPPLARHARIPAAVAALESLDLDPDSRRLLHRARVRVRAPMDPVLA